MSGKNNKATPSSQPGSEAAEKEISGLRKEISRLNFIINNVSDAVYIEEAGMGGGPGPFAQANEAARRLSADSAVGGSRTFLPVSGESERAVLDGLARGEMGPFPVQGEKRDGTPFRGEARFQGVDFGDGRVLAAVLRDATEEAGREERLRHGERRLRRLVDNAIDAIYLFDLQGRVVDVNRAACEALGRSREELLGLGIWDIDRDQTLEDFRVFWEARLDDEPVLFQTTHKRKDGSTFPVEVNALSFTEKGERFLYGIARNITERIQAREHAASLARFPSENPNPVCRADLDGVLTYANPAALELLRAWGIGQGDLLPVELRSLIDRSCREKRGAEADVAVGGRIFTIQASPVPGEGCVNLYGLDVTRRVRMEEALRESEERFRTAVAEMPIPLCITHRNHGVEFLNQSFTQAFGYTTGQISTMESWWEEFCPDPEYRAEVRDAWGRAVAEAGGGEIEPQEWRVRRRDGEYRDVEFRMVPLGERAVIALVDLTSFRALESQLRGARDVAEAASRAESEFLANMSHEIRTPLNGVMGMLQLVQSFQLGEEVREYVDSAIFSCLRLTRLMGDILDLSKVEAGKLEVAFAPFDFADTINSVRQLFVPAAKQAGLDLSFSIDPSIPRTLVGDGYRFQQVLNNLVGNAMKFTESGGVEVEAVPLSGRHEHECRVLVTVADTGVGISDHALEGLFSAFTQGEANSARKVQGAGLGLYICKRLVALMGGGIDVASREGGGTTVYLHLSFGLHREEEKPRPVPAPVPDSALSGRNILLAEDDQLSQVFIAQLLRRSGCRVKVVEDGEQALAALLADDFDAVLMDVQMPIMDGVEATRVIRNDPRFGKAGDVPIIAFTAFAMSGDEERFLKAGMDGYLAKPVEGSRIKELLKRVIDAREKKRASDRP